MNQFKTIDSQILAALSKEARNAPRRRMNQNFHVDDQALCHRMLNAVEPDSYVPPHRHLSPDKAETIIVLAGRVGVLAFDEAGQITMFRILAPNSGTVGVDIPAGVMHSVVALEPGSVFFESKAGPYLPLAQEEKASWAPSEGSEAAKEYLEFMRACFKP
ncbi:MAG: cupin fold metalloprotein, WbuC family [Proteobacteria bacterium]|nr:cupin fold metalloprotein, WbuC family [Pseudomonadota bacterium]